MFLPVYRCSAWLSSGTARRHWRVEFMKHVLLRLTSPGGSAETTFPLPMSSRKTAPLSSGMPVDVPIITSCAPWTSGFVSAERLGGAGGGGGGRRKGERSEWSAWGE